MQENDYITEDYSEDISCNRQVMVEQDQCSKISDFSMLKIE